MDDKEYWEKRASERLLMGEKSADELLQTMKPVYNNSLAEMNKEVQAFYGRYAENNNLTLAEVNKRLDPKELKSAKVEIKKYYDAVDKLARNSNGKVDVKLLHQYKDELRLQSAKAYMSRLEELKIGLKNITVHLGIKESEEYYQTLSKIYGDNYKRTNFDIDKFLGFSTGFETLNYKKLNTAVYQRWLGMNFSDRIWNNKGKLFDQINTTFLQGVAQGHNPKKIAESMAKNMGTSYYNCERLARTECAHIAGEATLQGYKDRGTEQYKFDATLDDRTSDICQSLDGEVFDVKEAQAGVNYPPMHPNCRSTTVPYFEPDEIDKMFDEAQRVARNEDGELYYVPASMTYKEWEQTMKNPAPPVKTIKDMDFVETGWRTKDKQELLQPEECDTIEGLYKMAEECKKEFSQDTDSMIAQFKSLNPVVLKRKTLKGEKRIKEKLQADQIELNEKGSKTVVYDPKTNTYHTRSIRDIDGHTLVAGTTKDVERMLFAYNKNPKVVRLKNNFAKPSPVGYKDINMNLKMSNGVIVEVQLNTIPNMVAKENYGHALYEVYRSLLAKPEYKNLAEHMSVAQKNLYGEANKLSDQGGFPKVKPSDNLFDYSYKPFENKIKAEVKKALPDYYKAKDAGVFNEDTIKHFEHLINKIGL